ncbi:MAG: hypothetical protein JWM16_5391 [Verrucomicrobiales bacterium]|nr:hypothetical protein [Verrucomicrobiales bacterium]
MKKRILFVDDEHMVLEGLRRMLRPMRQEWEMEFLGSGAHALQRMKEATFDVIVSDMRMPGMNGAELLNNVMELHPRTIRFVLSGHADEDLILKCVGSTHQYISKPCEPEILKATIQRVTSLRANVENDRVQTLVAKLDRLPTLPSIHVQLTSLLASPNVPMDEIGALLGRDMAISASLLKVVNSAFFGLRREVTTPVEAVAYLGVDVIKALVLGIPVFSEFEGSLPGKFSGQTLWNHSLQVAIGAERIARFEGADIVMVKESFTAGLLHDVGKLVLAANFAADYSSCLKRRQDGHCSGLDAEREGLGATHAEVGGYLLGLWGLPLPVVQAVAFHHEPRTASKRGFSGLMAVHAANVLQQQLPSSVGEGAMLDEVYLEQAGFLNRVDAWKYELQKGPGIAV